MPTTPQMIMISAMVPTLAMFVCSTFSAATAAPQGTSPDDETAVADISHESSNMVRFVLSDIPPVYHCNDSLQCPSEFGFTRCENHLCVCDENFYQVLNKTSDTTYCRLCSLFQESCAVTQCCENPHATFCFNGLCVCRPGMDEECLLMIYRGRYTPTLGIQLANTLSVSFAFVFLAITFVAVIRKTLFRCDSMSRVASDSSLNEFIKQKMQNRPPCYDDIEKDRKVPIADCSTSVCTNNHQPPPEYGAIHFGRQGTVLRGSLNPSLSISDEVEMNTAPPNYSTFTTVTQVTLTTMTTAAETPTVRTNDEIILTQPIYANREFLRLG
ncbi:uncharacterized protein LOC132931623 isoform X4 [Rhopalosiphum padi]|uniref:uncharacterized protein LOC132931623 isoform X4 n=1 Tax=Rhopalosiphum padi TaxID=40932 RepID=UPI00298E9A5C|nr:uncharacterized protein LOC132931623 isoform X4 [Rhopalosiphum padi]